MSASPAVSMPHKMRRDPAPRGSWWEPSDVEAWLASSPRSLEPKRGPGRRFAPAA